MKKATKRPMPPNVHPEKRLRDPFTKKWVRIDVGMCELVKLFWAHGIRTLYCCQSSNQNHGRAYVMFPTMKELNRVLKLFRRDADWRILAGGVVFAPVEYEIFVRNAHLKAHQLVPVMLFTPAGLARVTAVLKASASLAKASKRLAKGAP